MNNIQFELWKNCTNNCDFCFNKGQTCSDVETKIRIIKEVKYRIERLNFDYYDKIGFIGGELFGDQIENNDVFLEFCRLFKLCIDLLRNNKINQVNFTTNLLNKNNVRLYHILDLIKSFDLLSRFRLCTSFDSKYRFKDNFNIWEQNLLYIKENYPELNTHIEILPTQDFIEKCLSNEISINLLKEKYKSYIDYSDLNSGFFYKNKFEMESDVPGFFPKRETFKRWLITGYKNNWFKPEDICNYDVFFNELYMLDNNCQLVQYIRSGHCKQLPYGNVDKSDYIDSDNLMYQDVKDVWNQYLESNEEK